MTVEMVLCLRAEQQHVHNPSQGHFVRWTELGANESFRLAYLCTNFDKIKNVSEDKICSRIPFRT